MHAVLSEMKKIKKGSSHSNKPGERERAHARERECERSRQCGTDVMSVRQQQLDLTCSRFVQLLSNSWALIAQMTCVQGCLTALWL